MSTLVTALGAVLVAIITGSVAFLVARRSASGTVETSDASTVFTIQKTFTETVLRELDTLRKLVKEVQEAEEACKQQVARLTARINTMETAADKAKLLAEAQATAAKLLVAAQAEAARIKAAAEAEATLLGGGHGPAT